MMHPTKPKSICPLVLLVLTVGNVTADDEKAVENPLYEVTFRQKDSTQKTVNGEVVVEASDGGIMLRGRDGQLYSVPPRIEVSRKKLDASFAPFSHDEMAKALLTEFGGGFEIHTTPDYVICSNAGKAYSKWCGVLFQRLAAAFRRQWQKDLTLHDPKFPLVAIVFRDRQQFAQFATVDAGPEMADSGGYYSIKTNRIVLFDLTNSGSGSAANDRDVARRLAARPDNAATIVHEATHQIAFNTGLHTRYADNPLWLTEGMAMYFETPDLRTPKGWKTAGRINLNRLKRFRDYAANRRKDDSLTALIQNGDRFQKADTIVDAYAESWALNYYLIKTHRKQYTNYLQLLQRKPRAMRDDEDGRLNDFSKSIGKSVEKLESGFLRYMKRLRR